MEPTTSRDVFKKPKGRAPVSKKQRKRLLRSKLSVSQIIERSATHLSTAENTLAFKNSYPPLKLHVKNMVCGINMNCNLNLSLIYSRNRFSEYNPTRFAGCILRMRDPKVTGICYSSGKLTLFGARSYKMARLAGLKYLRIFHRIGHTEIRQFELKTHNVVGISNLHYPINLDAFYDMHTQFCRYEPEVFPALVYRLVKPRVVLLIFANGKLVITGGKSQNDLNVALDVMNPILRCFRKTK